MPIDRKLSLEVLKDTDIDLYCFINTFEELREYLRKDVSILERLQYYTCTLDAIDKLEKEGTLEVINDYDKKAVYLRNKAI